MHGTMVITDIEGSTALWDDAPEAMDRALVIHDDLFVSANTTGDGELGQCVTGKVERWMFPAELAADVTWTFEWSATQ